jgi:hypothetical protein
MLLGSIPFIFFALCALVLLQFHQEEKDGIDMRVILVTACIISSVWLVVGTELLSLFGGIRFGPVLLWWVVPLIGMCVFFIWRRKQFGKVSLAVPKFVALDWLLLIPTILLLVSAGLSSWFSAPNNWDSMIYHLPRQVYWMQHHTVAHYPATGALQILMPPFSEFMGLHLMILSGGDRWANMVQCFSFAMVMVVVSLIARDLGAGRRGQILAAFLVASAPTIFIFASNTKNDVVLALWVCLLAWWALRMFIDREHGPVRALLIGSTLGLAVLTKGTSYIFALASCLLIGIEIIRSTRRFAKPAIVIIATAILLNSGHWIRNYGILGSPIGYDHHMEEDFNKSFGPAVLMSNILRNITLHLGTPEERFNGYLQQSVEKAHDILGIDEQDRRTTFLNIEYKVSYTPHMEDATPAGAHVILVGLTLIMALSFRLRPPGGLLYIYLTIPLAGFVLFCMMLQWTPWHTRLHIPLLCLFMPASAVISLYPTFVHNTRPLLGSHTIFKSDRTAEMFRVRPELLAGSVSAADLVAKVKPRSVGISSDWEYHLQRLIMDRMEPRPMFYTLHAQRSENEIVPWPADLEGPEIIIARNWFPLVYSDRTTGVEYRMIGGAEPYGIFHRSDMMNSTGFWGSLPPFAGWSADEGLHDKEGPYPQWELPIVRWGGGEQTTFAFLGDGRPLLLSMTCGKHHLQWQKITVSLNGERLGRYHFDIPGEFKDLEIPFSARKGYNFLEIEYQNQDDTYPDKPLALLFKRLQIRPPEFADFATDTSENP